MESLAYNHVNIFNYLINIIKVLLEIYIITLNSKKENWKTYKAQNPLKWCYNNLHERQHVRSKVTKNNQFFSL